MKPVKGVARRHFVPGEPKEGVAEGNIKLIKKNKNITSNINMMGQNSYDQQPSKVIQGSFHQGDESQFGYCITTGIQCS